MFKFRKTWDRINAYLRDFWRINYTEFEQSRGHTILEYNPISDIRFEKIVQIAYDLLNENQMYVDPNRDLDEVRIEMHNYYTDGHEVESSFSEHCSNDAHITPVNTCIFYLRKDPHIIGGNLIISDAILRVKSGTYVAMEGDLVHAFQSISGYGNSQCIIVHIPKLIC